MGISKVDRFDHHGLWPSYDKVDHIADIGWLYKLDRFVRTPRINIPGMIDGYSLNKLKRHQMDDVLLSQ